MRNLAFRAKTPVFQILEMLGFLLIEFIALNLEYHLFSAKHLVI